MKRYVEQVLAQSERWKQLCPYFSHVSISLRAYTLTSHEVELMQKILDFHLNDTLHLRISAANDQLIEYDDLLDFIRRLQDYAGSNPHSSNNNRPNIGKKTAIPSIQAVHSSYILPPSAKSMMPSLSQPTPPKTSPVKPILAKPAAPLTNNVPTQPLVSLNKTSNSTTTTINGHNTSNVQIKPNLISPPGNVLFCCCYCFVLNKSFSYCFFL